ncbi:hypothetical protein [Longimicrobium sp.]|uniref:hypothetical protein n=1 Tax=Longimicrobium sp. TaxID=2029185 RepID=UPI003B3BC84C
MDDAVEEVRAIRRQISARFDHDPVELVEHYMERQKRYGDRRIDQPKSKRTDDSTTGGPDV